MLFMILVSRAQIHHALNGSVYAGSLGVHQNPASSLSSKDTFDITIASIQLNNYSNLLKFGYAPLLKKNPTLTLEPSVGDYKRTLNTNLRINLLNTKYKFNEKNAIGFGINLRSVVDINTGHYNLTDSVTDLFEFLRQNTGSLPFRADAASSNWLEYYANFSHTLLDTRKYILNVGGNVKLNKGLLGLDAALSNLDYQKSVFLGAEVYEAKNADFEYGFSSTVAGWDNTLRLRENVRSLMKETKNGASIDLGAELLIKNESTSDWFYEGLEYDYSWKVGIALLDLGYARYHYYPESVVTSGMKENLTPDILFDKFFGAFNNIAAFNDTLETIVSNYRKLTGNFLIYHPSRLLFNIDRKLTHSIYVNAALSLPFSFVQRANHNVVNDIGYLTLTPRVESELVGLYLPVTFTTTTKWKLGAAIRVGPLVFGMNNWNIFNNNTDLQNQSGYLSFIFRFKKKEKKPNYNFLLSPRKLL
jgi:hypothetical protein